MKKLAILGSGSGSNMQAILDAIQDGRLKAEIAVVASDNADAYILERAKKAGISALHIDCGEYKSKFPKEDQEKLAVDLKQRGVDMVCLAGFMRMVGAPLLSKFPNRILNIHPSLLPHYPGLAAWEQALNDKAKVSGCTVHYVDAGMDTGAIIKQAEVPVLENDTSKSLHERIQKEERTLYPEVIAQILS